MVTAEKRADGTGHAGFGALLRRAVGVVTEPRMEVAMYAAQGVTLLDHKMHIIGTSLASRPTLFTGKSREELILVYGGALTLNMPRGALTLNMPPERRVEAEIKSYRQGVSLPEWLWHKGMDETAFAYLALRAFEKGAETVRGFGLPQGIDWDLFRGPNGEYIGYMVSSEGYRKSSTGPGLFEHIELSRDDIPKLERFLLRDSDGNSVGLSRTM